MIRAVAAAHLERGEMPKDLGPISPPKLNFVIAAALDLHKTGAYPFEGGRAWQPCVLLEAMELYLGEISRLRTEKAEEDQLKTDTQKTQERMQRAIRKRQEERRRAAGM